MGPLIGVARLDPCSEKTMLDFCSCTHGCGGIRAIERIDVQFVRNVLLLGQGNQVLTETIVVRT